MLELKKIVSDISYIKNVMLSRSIDFDEHKFTSIYEKRKQLILEIEALQYKRNSGAKEISEKLSRKESVDTIMQEMNQVKLQIDEINSQLKENNDALDQLMYYLPNLPSSTVPVGKTEEDNKKIREVGTPTKFDFEILDHIEIGKRLNIIDFERGAQISAARFTVMYGLAVKLHRALIRFMIDIHVKNGYEEVYVPYMVNGQSLYNTGQLPKFEEDLFAISNTNFYLIPTAEVPLTNLGANRIFNAKELPLKFVSHSPCFRSEAGSYGRDVKGMIRQHQFEKVELVKITHPDTSFDELENMTLDAERILQLLKLPYRTMLLCTGDMGFAAAKTYDIEVWMPSQNTYREISSCSCCTDFQARRMKSRFKEKNKSNKLVHTLNGSGLAVGRTLVAILENYQQSDGTVTIPEVLKPYMDGLEKISL